ncbi:uncharacterized protein LOC110681914 [Chenopodium quinoa]|uniref:uncharacterized protein LOC110681914 n=1 Tax=Chenopodium quinoa TaxID=63459 RepID=UPI000B7939E0|nr:uncharacterized protein LOC110681914 [Chenopodium quinoa]
MAGASGRGKGGAEVRVVATGSLGASSSSGDANTTSLPGMTAAQWQQFLDMVGNAKVISDERLIGESLETSWIIDTGASNHVTCNLKFLSNVVEITSCPIGLPDGKKAHSTKQGQVRLAHGLTLQNVLYVPQLNCNLISITQLTDDTKCVVQFTNNLCVIQDPNRRTLIGAGERRDGLYYFCDVPKVRALVVGDHSTPELWHQRLGHPSDKVVQSLPVVVWLVEEANFKATTELFSRKGDGKTLDSFIPKSESDFLEYAELISHKLRPYEKSYHYVGLLKAVMRLSTASLKAANAKEVAASVTAIANEKLKAEKDANAGKKKTGLKKKQLLVDKPDDDLAVAGYDDNDDYDFM